MITNKEVMNIKQLAFYLGCGESSIRKLIRNNAIQYYKIGNRYLFKKDDIDNWIETSKNFFLNNSYTGGDIYGYNGR